MTLLTIASLVCTIALLLTAALVPVVRRLAVAGRLYERPVANRWHRLPVPKLGGVAMGLIFVGVCWALADTAALRALLAVSGAMCLLGLIDDLRPMGPAVKFTGQFAAAASFLWVAPSIDLTGIPAVDAVLAFAWFVGITNAFNLLDNIDGAAAGIAAIAGAFFVAALLLNGAPALNGLTIAAAGMTGVALGFLIYNWHPASIFMGDSGSHLIGSFFAGATILAAPHVHQSSGIGVAVGVILLLVPCVDTTLVILTRQLAGQSAFVGGRDHLSHRIVALGLDDRRAVLVLYGLAVLGGFVALGLQNLPPAIGWIPAALYGIAVAALGIYLGHVDVTGSGRARRQLPLPIELTSRYRIYEIAFDATLIAVAYYVSVLVRFRGSSELNEFLARAMAVLPLVLLLHVAGLWIGGKYRKPARTGGFAEALTLVQGVLIGSAASVIAVLYITRFVGYSRQVFAVAGVLALFLLAGGHVVLRGLDDLLRRRRANGPTALVYGAGRRGALVVREIMENPSLAFVPAGLIDDDDDARRGERVEGIRVLGSLADLDEVLTRFRGSVSVVIVSIGDLPAERFGRLCDICEHHGVEVRQFRASLEEVEMARPDQRADVLRFPRL